MWIESHQELRDHRKTKALRRLLKINTVSVIGHLHLLWWWCLTNAPGGDLTGIPDEDLADAALWKGDPNRFVSALKTAGFIDQNRPQLHNWYDYAGKLLEKTKARQEQNRQAQIRHRLKFAPVSANCQQPVSKGNADCHTPTVPNLTSNPIIPLINNVTENLKENETLTPEISPVAPSPKPPRKTQREELLELVETSKNQYPDIDIAAEFRRFEIYWLEKGRVLKRPKTAWLNWLANTKKYQAEKQPAVVSKEADDDGYYKDLN